MRSANGGPKHRTRISIDGSTGVVRGLPGASMGTTVGNSILAQGNG
jgi:hypothetical protein